MSVEENGHKEVPPRGDSGKETSFDDVVRGVATGAVSRRKALRLLGAALAGSVLGSVPGVAWAVQPANRGGGSCAGLCSALFVGSARGQCIRGAAQGTGPVRVCSAGCTDTRTDVNNCGGCGTVCQHNAALNPCGMPAC